MTSLPRLDAPVGAFAPAPPVRPARLPRRFPALLERTDVGRRRRRLPSFCPPTASSASSLVRPAIHQDEDGSCVFGKKDYWDQMYRGGSNGSASSSELPSEAYSWYCGWEELRPFWQMLVPDTTSRVVVAGIGNDPSPVGMYDAGYTNMMAYDYSTEGVDRARELFGADRRVELVTADARDLPIGTESVDATLDKGTLDAIFITGEGIFREAVKEMGRVTAVDGCVVSISRVIDTKDLLAEFDTPLWENVHDGGLAFAPDGEASIDLGAGLYSWKRTAVGFDNY